MNEIQKLALTGILAMGIFGVALVYAETQVYFSSHENSWKVIRLMAKLGLGAAAVLTFGSIFLGVWTS